MPLNHPHEPPLTPSRWPSILLGAILIVYAGLVVGYAVRTPAWQAPDEPAHFQVIAQVAAAGCCPVIAPGDWDQAYLSQLTSARFDPALLNRLAAVQYEDHQPPLYYLGGTVVYAASGGSLLAVRLWSALLGGIAVILAYSTARVMFADRPVVALGAAALVAFIPQHLAILGSVNNDAAADVVIGAGLLATMLYLRGAKVPAWALGVIAGVGVLTKANSLLLGLVMPLAILLRWLATRDASSARSWGVLIRNGLAFGLPALLIGAIWWVRNIIVYGWPDIFGLGAHDAVVTGQLRTADVIAEVGWSEYLRRAAETTFNSFWGQFGWMALPLPGWAYTLIGIGLAIIAVGIGAAFVRRGRSAAAHRPLMWAILWAVIALALAQYAYYNTSFYQLQGRYLFPLLIPFGILAGWGLDALGGLFFKAARSPARALAVIPLCGLIPLNLYVLWRVIPLLAP